MASPNSSRLPGLLTIELYYIVSQKSKHGEDRSAYVQNFKATAEEDRFEWYVGLPAGDSASFLLVLMRSFTRFLANVELSWRVGIANMGIETYV